MQHWNFSFSVERTQQFHVRFHALIYATDVLCVNALTTVTRRQPASIAVTSYDPEVVDYSA